MKNDNPNKPSDSDEYNQYVINEIEKGGEPESFFDWYINKYHGYIIDASKKEDD